MKLSILFAYRNREPQRIKNSLFSLQKQYKSAADFEVVFVDYGSTEDFQKPIQKVVESFSFARYNYVAHKGLLWNKSKTLNYAALQARAEFIFVADVDICFDNYAVNTIHDLANKNKFILFKLSYLKQNINQEQIQLGNFTNEHIKHHGDINGMLLVSKQAFFEVSGYDEFYHFYGSEDVDMCERLKNSGLEKCKNSDTLFYHQWHPIYNSINDSVLEQSPRFFNIKKINQQHYFYQKKENAIHPLLTQKTSSKVWNKEDELTETDADQSFSITNDHAKVWHLLNVLLPVLKNRIVCITVKKDEYFNSTKFKLKKRLKKSDRVPISMKLVNDLILQEIVLRYRDNNYTYKISNELKSILFILKK